MPIAVQSSIAINAELTAMLQSISPAGFLLIYDSAGNEIASVPLGNPAGAISGPDLVLLGLPALATGSSNTAVGDGPFSATVVNNSLQPIISGLNVIFPTNTIMLTSSSISPGQQFGVVGGIVSIP